MTAPLKDPLRVEKQKVRALRKELDNLTKVVSLAIKALDNEMKQPSSDDRGSRIAKITNALELQTQIAIRYGLNT